MGKSSRGRVSPALVISIVALVLAAGGTSFAQAPIAFVAKTLGLTRTQKKQVTSIADKEIKSKTPKLSVLFAKSAGSAATAGSAASAANAQNAVTASNATSLGGTPASSYLLTGTSGEGWHLIGAAGQPAFENFWINDTPLGGAPAGFYLDPIGRVHLKGVIDEGIPGTKVFILPPGYRPPESLAFAVAAGEGGPVLEKVNVKSNGEVITAGAAGSAVPLWLDGISFRVG
jgi:hypothetical protein